MLNMKGPPVRSVMALPFRPVDIDAQARKYRLEQRGAEDGRRDYPPSDAEDEAQAEIAITGAVDADRQRCLTDLSATLRACRDALARLQTAMTSDKCARRPMTRPWRSTRSGSGMRPICAICGR
jgi:hypothetical protein